MDGCCSGLSVLDELIAGKMSRVYEEGRSLWRCLVCHKLLRDGAGLLKSFKVSARYTTNFKTGVPDTELFIADPDLLLSLNCESGSFSCCTAEHFGFSSEYLTWIRFRQNMYFHYIFKHSCGSFARPRMWSKKYVTLIFV